MEKRLIVAVLLMSAVIMLTNILFPPPVPEEVVVEETTEQPAPPAAPPEAVRIPVATPSPGEVPADTVRVVSDLYTLTLSTRGASVAGAQLRQFESYTQPGPVQLVPESPRDFLSSRLVIGADTVDLAALPFTPSARTVQVGPEGPPASLTFSHGDANGFGVEITYTFAPDSYLFDVTGRVSGLGGRPATLITEIGPGLGLHEAREHHSEQQLAVVTRVPGDVTRLRMNRLPAEQTLADPFTWVGIKDKYFLGAIVAGDQTPLQGAVVRRLPDAQHLYADDARAVTIPQADVLALVPVSATGEFSYRTFLGPQDFTTLRAVGYDLENVTQYAYRWLEPVIRPVAALILWVLRWLHNTFGLAYGWVLVLFGVLMRIVLWPLNAKAMRAQMKNMGVQPLMAEIREKYADDRRRSSGDDEAVQGARLQPVRRVSPAPGAVPDPDHALLRLPEHHRVPGCGVPLAPRPVAAGPALHPAGLPGHLHVRAAVDQHEDERDGAEPADEDDDVRDARDDGHPLLQPSRGAEPVLRDHQHREHPAADVDRA
jgi:YidC/Oxa1 family membrane protein insertase